ncbi:uncharacterized protein LOC123401822 [Hordeum vulgare subsp. vulgare]|uniref:Predicted protein n=1 Tax=Hordeum vulgare subsp. vulgare TaxID=112509 RepID=F2E0M9_HORVV|nr:uncharacterized protein LOC123401822 [Hordeum vulgare subsp. vulgare]KAI4980266.1 hypothetical protein ZWY2020_020751 [Hordeum vulgare]BAK00901.1 predicted protein [Hordeum vulgare subsp. vulgare]
MATTSAGGEFEIQEDEGFVFKLPGVLYPDGAEDTDTAAPSTTAADLESARLQRRRRALLHLRAKYKLEFSRWESLSSDILAPPPAPTAATSVASSASPLPLTPLTATISLGHTILDDYLAEVEVHEEMLKRASQMCDEIVEFCNEHEAALVDAAAALPVWGDPRELVKSLCSPDEQAAVQPVCGNPRVLMNSVSSPAEKTLPGTPSVNKYRSV